MQNQEIVIRIKEITKCTHEQAMDLLGFILELQQKAYMQGYGRGYNDSKKQV